MADDAPRREPSGAWWALGACTLTIILTAGTRTSFAAFIPAIEQDLGLDRLTLSTAGSLTLLFYGLAVPFAGRLAARYGARPVMMTAVVLMALGGFGVSVATDAWPIMLFAGIVPGLGFAGATTVPATVLLARWFDRRLGLATGILSSAIPAGQSMFLPLVAVLIPVLGWRSTYILLGFLLAAVALPVLWRWAREPTARDVPRRTAAGAGRKAGLDVWLLGIGFFTCGYTDQFVALHLISLGVDRGLDAVTAAGLLSFLLVVGILGSVVSGPVADTWRPHAMLGSLYLLRAASLPLLLLVGPGAGLWPLGLFAVLFGVTYIANQAPGTRYVRDRYGVGSVGALMGNVGFAHQVGGAVGIWVGGASVAWAGGYGASIGIAAVVALIGGALQFLVPRAQARQA